MNPDSKLYSLMILQVFHVPAPDLVQVSKHMKNGASIPPAHGPGQAWWLPQQCTAMLWSSATGSSYLIVRTEMQYFHIRLHMLLTSSGWKLEIWTGQRWKRPRCFEVTLSWKLPAWERSSSPPTSIHPCHSFPLSSLDHNTCTSLFLLLRKND